MGLFLDTVFCSVDLCVCFLINIYFGLHWVIIAVCELFLVTAIEGYSQVAVRGLLIMVASFVEKNRL